MALRGTQPQVPDRVVGSRIPKYRQQHSRHDDEETQLGLLYLHGDLRFAKALIIMYQDAGNGFPRKDIVSFFSVFLPVEKQIHHGLAVSIVSSFVVNDYYVSCGTRRIVSSSPHPRRQQQRIKDVQTFARPRLLEKQQQQRQQPLRVIVT